MVQASAATAGDRLLRLPDVETKTGLKKTAIYAGMKAGTFPPCVKLGVRASAWSQSAVDGWIQDRIRQASRGR